MSASPKFTWKTPMRASVGGTDEDRAARQVDRLGGQVAAQRLDDGRWQVIVMPDAGTFDSMATVSAEDMRALAHAILDADRPALEAPPLARVEIIDVAEQARALYGDHADRIAGHPVPEHDYRFRDNSLDGSDGTYGTAYTATDVMTSILSDRELKAKGL